MKESLQLFKNDLLKYWLLIEISSENSFFSKKNHQKVIF